MLHGERLGHVNIGALQDLCMNLPTIVPTATSDPLSFQTVLKGDEVFVLFYYQDVCLPMNHNNFLFLEVLIST